MGTVPAAENPVTIVVGHAGERRIGDGHRPAAENPVARMTRTLVIGAGCSRGCPEGELAELVGVALAELDRRVEVVATIDARATEPCVRALVERLGVALVTYPAAALARVTVPSPSALVAAHVGTPSVAEAAALLGAGEDAVLVARKRRSAHATCAIAGRAE